MDTTVDADMNLEISNRTYDGQSGRLQTKFAQSALFIRRTLCSLFGSYPRLGIQKLVGHRLRLLRLRLLCLRLSHVFSIEIALRVSNSKTLPFTWLQAVRSEPWDLWRTIEQLSGTLSGQSVPLTLHECRKAIELRGKK